MVQNSAIIIRGEYKFLRLKPRFLQKTEFMTHFTAETERGVAAHSVGVGFAVRW